MPINFKKISILCVLPLMITIAENVMSMDEEKGSSFLQHSSHNLPFCLDLNKLPQADPEHLSQDKNEFISKRTHDFLTSLANEIKEQNKEEKETKEEIRHINTQYRAEKKQINPSYNTLLKNAKYSTTYKEKFDYLHSALKVAKNDGEKARAYLYLGSLCSIDSPEKEGYYLLALDILGQKNSHFNLKGEIYLYLGNLPIYNPEKKLLLFSEAINIFHANRSNWNFETSAYMGIGATLQYEIKDYRAAIEAYDAALDILEQTNKQGHRYYQMILNNRQLCFRETKQHPKETEVSSKRVRLFSDSQLQEEDEEQHRSKRARINKTTYENVINNAEDEIRTSRTVPLRNRENRDDANRKYCEEETLSELIDKSTRLDNDRAIILLQEALGIAQRDKNEDKMIKIYIEFGYRFVNYPEQQIKYFSEAIRIATEKKASFDIAKAYIGLSNISSLQPNERRQYLLKALSVVGDPKYWTIRAKVWLKMGNYFKNVAKQSNLAIQAYSNVIQICDRNTSEELSAGQLGVYRTAIRKKEELLRGVNQREQKTAPYCDHYHTEENVTKMSDAYIPGLKTGRKTETNETPLKGKEELSKKISKKFQMKDQNQDRSNILEAEKSINEGRKTGQSYYLHNALYCLKHKGEWRLEAKALFFLGEIYEYDDHDRDRALRSYEKAMQMLKNDNAEKDWLWEMIEEGCSRCSDESNNKWLY